MAIVIPAEILTKYERLYGVDARVSVENLAARLSEASEELTNENLRTISEARGIANGFSHAGHHSRSACEWTLSLANRVAYDAIILESRSSDGARVLAVIEATDFGIVAARIEGELSAIDGHTSIHPAGWPPRGIRGLVSELAMWQAMRVTADVADGGKVEIKQIGSPSCMAPLATATASQPVAVKPVDDEAPLAPKVYLSGWLDILEAVGLKNNNTDKNKVLSLNKRYQGPIPKVGRGGKPRVEKGKLLDWWNGLEEKFQASDAARKDKASAAASALVQQAKAVYISYKCGDDTDAGREREAFIDRLDTSLQTAGYNVRRDKRDIGYKDLIDKFMDELARGHCIVVVLNNEYLHSRFCMDELVRIYLNHNFCKRIVPVVLPDVAGLTPMRRMEYVEFWREQQVEHQQAFALNLGGISHEGFSDFDRVRRIAQNCDAALSHIFAMNCLNQTELEGKDFQILKQAIDERMEETSAQAGRP